jgi:hypothetical protein
LDEPLLSFGELVQDWVARDMIRQLKAEEGMGAADDLLYDFTTEMLGKTTGQGIECLGTLKDMITWFL